jgi:cobalt/nickel transport system permease protein
MHLGDGALTPECAILAWGAAGVGLGAAAIDLARKASEIGSNKLASAAALGSFVFVAQMFNLPVLPGISAHLVGGVLLAWMLGPSLGVWTMALVLAAQALILGDGGIASLGANIVNMALLPAGTVYLLQRLNCRRVSFAAGAAALTVIVAALLIPLETALFRSAGELAGWSDFSTRMFLSHLAAGSAEAVLTLVLLVPFCDRSSVARPFWQTSLVSASICLALLVTFIACRTELPDAYEAAAQSSGLTWLLK